MASPTVPSTGVHKTASASNTASGKGMATTDTASEYIAVVVAAVAVILHHCDWKTRKQTYIYMHT